MPPPPAPATDPRSPTATARPTPAPPGPMRLPRPDVPHVYLEKGFGFGTFATRRPEPGATPAVPPER